MDDAIISAVGDDLEQLPIINKNVEYYTSSMTFLKIKLLTKMSI